MRVLTGHVAEQRTMRLVVLESPYAAKTFIGRWLNRRYARKCMLDSLGRGEAPMVSHLLYTQCLDDRDDNERFLGIKAGLAWGEKADATVVYEDRGISSGMRWGIATAKDENRPIEYRTLNSPNI